MLGKDSKEVFARNLNYFLAKTNKSQIDVATDLGILASTFSTWCTGIRMPRMDKVQMLADYFGILKSDLIEDKLGSFGLEIYPVDSFSKVPIIGSVYAGANGVAQEDFEGYEYAADLRNPDGYRYLRVKGTSMMPLIYPGDLALVRLQDDVESGELAVVIVNGEEGLIKRLQKKANSVILLSANSDEYPPRIFVGKECEEVYVWGRVMKIERKF